MLNADNLLDELSDLHKETRDLLTLAKSQGDVRAALGAIREGRGNVEAFARIGPNAEIETRLAALEHPEQEQPDG